jgi:hypothetical protein
MTSEPDRFQLPYPWEAVQLACNLGRNLGWQVFPVWGNKKPAANDWLNAASPDEASIRRRWGVAPAPLVGAVTGEASGFDLLDLDLKHADAVRWWRANETRIPRAPTYRSRSGGLHLHFKHAAGLRCSMSRIARGIDVKADGGYAIIWFAAGTECLDYAPLPDWPPWLLRQLLPPPEPQWQESRPDLHRGDANKAVAGLVSFVAHATEGVRNSSLFWAAARMAERAKAGQISAAEGERLLTDAARSAGLPAPEIRSVLASARKTVG